MHDYIIPKKGIKCEQITKKNKLVAHYNETYFPLQKEVLHDTFTVQRLNRGQQYDVGEIERRKYKFLKKKWRFGKVRRKNSEIGGNCFHIPYWLVNSNTLLFLSTTSFFKY